MTIFSPDGQVVDTWDIRGVLNTASIIVRLRAAIRKLGTRPGEPVVPREPLRANRGDILIESVTRYNVAERDAQAYNKEFFEFGETPPGFQTSPGDMFPGRVRAPARDRFPLNPTQWRSLVGPLDAAVGAAWDVDPAVAAALLVHFAPPNEMYKLDASRLQKAEMHAHVTAVNGPVATIEIDGTVLLRHPWWTLKDDEYVDGSFQGFVTYDRAVQKITRFELASIDTWYRGGRIRPHLRIPLTVVMHTVPFVETTP